MLSELVYMQLITDCNQICANKLWNWNHYKIQFLVVGLGLISNNYVRSEVIFSLLYVCHLFQLQSR